MSVVAKLKYLRIAPRKVRLVCYLIRGKSIKEAESNLYISKIIVEEGPKLKRWRARARGTVASIQKKTSHITIILDEISKKPKKVKKVRKVEKAKGVKRIPRLKKPKLKPEMEISKPKIEKGVKRIFRRKAF